MHTIATPDHRTALRAAKLAVRAYARDPSQANQASVEEAWRSVRRLRSIARWRRALRPAPRRSAS